MTTPTPCLMYARVETKVKSIYSEMFLGRLLHEEKRTEVVGLVLFRFRSPVAGPMVALFDLFSDHRYDRCEWGIIPVEERFVAYTDDVSGYDAARLLVAMAVVAGARLKVADLFGTIDKRDTELQFVELCYQEFLRTVAFVGTQCRSTDERSKLWRDNSARIRRFKEVVERTRALHREKLIRDEKRVAVERATARLDDCIRQMLVLRDAMRDTRSPQRCKLTVLFALADGTVHTELVDRDLLFLYGNDEIETLLADKDETLLTIGVSDVDTARLAIDYVYTGRISGSVDQMLQIVPLLAELRCSLLLEDCIAAVRRSATPQSLARLLVATHFVKSHHKTTLQRLAFDLFERLIRHTNSDIGEKVARLSACPQLNRRTTLNADCRPV